MKDANYFLEKASAAQREAGLPIETDYAKEAQPYWDETVVPLLEKAASFGYLSLIVRASGTHIVGLQDIAKSLGFRTSTEVVSNRYDIGRNIEALEFNLEISFSERDVKKQGPRV